MSFTTFWYEALPFKISCCRDELWKHPWHSSCLSYFPWCLEKVYILFPAKDKASGMSTQGFWFCTLCTIFVVALICLSSCGVVRDYCSITLERRAGVPYKTNLLKALAPKFIQCRCREALICSTLIQQGPFAEQGLSSDVAILPMCLRHSFNPHCSH